MRFEWTAAAHRVLHRAAQWTTTPLDAVGPHHLLAGLLEESECHAALLLAERGITTAHLVERWPELTRRQDPEHRGETVLMSGEVEDAIGQALERLDDFRRPWALTTEHLLLGLAAIGGAPAEGLRAWGLTAESLERSIRSRYGYERCEAPLEWPGGIETPSKTRVDEKSETQAETQPDACDGGDVGVQGGVVRETGILRLLDAAANRAREGLRVVEDHARFSLDDGFLTAQLKTLRHELAAALARLPAAELLACRDTPGDVGTRLSTPQERSRSDLDAVLIANHKRLQESLRSLEEYGKLWDAELGAACEALRYRAYALEQAMTRVGVSQRRLRDARLYVLVAGQPSLERFELLVRAVLAGGADVVQLRDKSLDDRSLLARARRLRTLCRDANALCVVNDRPDLAVLAEADGVHVGQEELPAAAVRRLVGPRMLIGVSTHHLEQARQAVLDGADYLGCGPTFPSGTKAFAEFPGLPYLRAVAGELRLPAFAIGGIDAGNLAQVLDTGFRRVAVGGAVTAAVDPQTAAAALKASLLNASP